MKKITLFALITCLFSCSPSTEELKEDRNEKYLSQAQIYIQSKVDKANKDQDVTIEHFDNLTIDSAVVLSSQMLEWTKMRSLWNEYDVEKNYLDKLIEIDQKFNSNPDQMTIAARDKCQGILDSLIRWEERMELLPKNDTLGYSVQFKYDLKQSDGVSLKDRIFTIYFDKNHDINGDWNQ